MMRSMFAGVSGLRSHQTMMDVVGNNVANVNTIGFKSSRVIFADALSQLIRGASNGGGALGGGVNPQQIGLGVRISATDLQFTQGGTQLTGNATDVSLQGDGFFTVRQGTESLFTRAGAFHFDNQGYLVDPSGGVVQGWRAGTTGVIDRGAPIGDMQIPVGQKIEPVVTSAVNLRGNLDATAAVAGPKRTTMINIVDSQGIEHRMTTTFEKTAANTWRVEVLDPAGVSLGTTNLVFDPATGRLSTPTTPPQVTYNPAGGAPVTFALDFGLGTGAQLTQFGSPTDAQAISQNGSVAGELRSFAIGADGSVSGVFSNGASKTLGQLAVAVFEDPKGLLAASDSRFRSSAASGVPLTGSAGEGGRGAIQAGTLEMSNVELSQEFTNLILAQRGFQANSRVITTSDEMIQDLVNLKR